MKTKLFLVPLGASVIAAGTACSVISCTPDRTTFEIDFKAPQGITIDNIKGELHKDFAAIVTVGKFILKDPAVDFIVDYKSDNPIHLTMQQITWSDRGDGSYDLFVAGDLITSRDIQVVINAEEQILVHSRISETSPKDGGVKLSQEYATTGQEYDTEIQVLDPTGAHGMKLDPLDPLKILVDGIEIKKEEGSYDWQQDPGDTEKSTLKIFAKAIPSGTKSIEIIVNLVDKEGQLTIELEEGEWHESHPIGFSGRQNGHFVFKLQGTETPASEFKTLELKPLGQSTGVPEITFDKEYNQIIWSPIITPATYTYQLVAEYEDELGHKYKGETDPATPITLSFAQSKLEVKVSSSKIRIDEEQGRSSATTGSLLIDGRAVSEYAETDITKPKYSLTPQYDNIKIDEETGIVSVEPAIKPDSYEFRIHAECQNLHLSTPYSVNSGKISLVVETPTLSVYGGSTYIPFKEGEQGRDQKAWAFYWNATEKTTGITWSVEDASGAKPSGIDITNDGHVNWDSTLTAGEHKIFVKGVYHSDITGRDYTSKSTEITLLATEEQFVVSGSQILEGNEGEAGSCQFNATFGTTDVTSDENTDWSIENTGSGGIPEGMEIGLHTGLLTWKGNIDAAASQDIYNFTVKATYHGTAPVKDYNSQLAPVTFKLTPATLEWDQQGSSEIYGKQEGDAWTDEQAWTCKLNGKPITEGVTYTTEPVAQGLLPEDIAFVNVEEGLVHWDKDAAHIRQGDIPDQDFNLIASYKIESIPSKDPITVSTTIKMKIDAKSSSITYEGSTTPTLPTIIEDSEGTDTKAFTCNWGSQPYAGDVKWSLTNVQPAGTLINIDETTGILSWGKISCQEQAVEDITFNVAAEMTLPWGEKRTVTSEQMLMHVSPLIFKLVPSKKIEPISGNEGFAGDSGDLTFKTTIGPSDTEQTPATGDTDFEFLADEPVKSALSFDKTTGKIKWNNTLLAAEGGYKFKLKAIYNPAESSNREISAISDEMTLNLSQNTLYIKYPEGALTEQCAEYTEWTWHDPFEPRIQNLDVGIGASCDVTLSGVPEALTGMELVKDGDTYKPKLPKDGVPASDTPYEFYMNASYTYAAIEKTITAEPIKLSLTVTAHNLEVTGGPAGTLTDEEWHSGQDTQQWHVSLQDVGDVTEACTFKLHTDTGTLPEGAVYVDTKDGYTKWHDNIQAGTYVFHFDIEYNYLGHKYTTATDKITLNVSQINFELTGGVTTLTTTEWTTGEVPEAGDFHSQLAHTGFDEDVTNKTTWSIVNVSDPRVNDSVVIENGKLKWKDSMSYNLNGATFQVRAVYDKTETNTHYEALSNAITISVTESVPSIGGPEEFTFRAGRSTKDTWQGDDKNRFRIQLDNADPVVEKGTIVEWTLAEVDQRIIDAPGARVVFEGLAGQGETTSLMVSWLPELVAGDEPLSIKIHCSWKQPGRDKPYEADKVIKITTLPAPETLLKEMEWSTIGETLRHERGDEELAEKLGFDMEHEEPSEMVGLTKEITLKGGTLLDPYEETYNAIIIAVHDDVDADGNKLTLTWELFEPLKKNGQMLKSKWAENTHNPDGTLKTYLDSDVNKYLSNTIWPLFDAYKDIIKPANKEYETFDKDDPTKVSVTSSPFNIWLLSAYEMAFSDPASWPYTELGVGYWWFMKYPPQTGSENAPGDSPFVNPTLDASWQQTWTRSVQIQQGRHYADTAYVWGVSQNQGRRPIFGFNKPLEYWYFFMSQEMTASHDYGMIVCFCM